MNVRLQLLVPKSLVPLVLVLWNLEKILSQFFSPRKIAISPIPTAIISQDIEKVSKISNLYLPQTPASHMNIPQELGKVLSNPMDPKLWQLVKQAQLSPIFNLSVLEKAPFTSCGLGTIAAVTTNLGISCAFPEGPGDNLYFLHQDWSSCFHKPAHQCSAL
jgi:hypothetical protein